jgi:glutamate 5-kinase
MTASRERRETTRPLVLKIGTTTLCGDAGRPQPARFAGIASQVAALHRAGRPVVVVSSGAIATGRGVVGGARKESLADRQALAAVGQPLLMREYDRHFSARGIKVAQVLLTGEDMMARRRYLNARNTFAALLRRRIVPIVNENDTVATDEIKIGDNDTLSAQVAVLVGAELLCILSDVDGLYTADPRRDASAQRIREVHAITPEVERAARRSASDVGTGGMQTKIAAARLAMAAGCAVVIADGRTPRVVERVAGGERLGTWFLPPGRGLTGRKRWLVARGRVRGQVVVDDGAVRAIREEGRSLLPSGIQEARGAFGAGDLIAVLDARGREVARGVAGHDRATIDAMKGQRSEQIRGLAGRQIEAIHRNDLVLS